MACKYLTKLLNEQKNILERHLDNHKWFNHINDKQKAVADFVEKYGWIMRETFCDLCSESETCQDYKNYLESRDKKYSKSLV